MKKAGRPKKDPKEKKVTLAFQVKAKHKTRARVEIQPIIDKINAA